MAKPVLVIESDSKGEFRFGLRSSNNENILHASEGYTTKQNCKKAIASVRVNSQIDSYSHRSFSKDAKHYFTLHAANGETLEISEMYETTAGLAPDLKQIFSFKTCSGCHAGATKTSFTHVRPRIRNEETRLSNFLEDKEEPERVRILQDAFLQIKQVLPQDSVAKISAATLPISGKELLRKRRNRVH